MPDDRFNEKDREKREEKAPQEKSWDEKYRRDRLGPIVWAAIFIWAGLVLLAENLGWLSAITIQFYRVPGLPEAFHPVAWSVIFIGAGVILLLEVLVRALVPEYRRPVFGSLFLGLLLIGIGLGEVISWNVIWPLILIALGLSIVLGGAWRRR